MERTRRVRDGTWRPAPPGRFSGCRRQGRRARFAWSLLPSDHCEELDLGRGGSACRMLTERLAPLGEQADHRGFEPFAVFMILEHRIEHGRLLGMRRVAATDIGMPHVAVLERDGTAR